MSFKSIQQDQQEKQSEMELAAEAQRKKLRLLVYWSFSTTLIVFGAITTYITLWTRPFGASMVEVILSGFPIWGVTGLAAAVLVGGYYLLFARRALSANG